MLTQKEFILFFYVLLLTGFWGLQIPIVSRFDAFMFVCSVPLLIFIFQQKGTNLIFKKYIYAFYLCILFNAVACFVNRGQSIYLSMTNTYVMNFAPIFLYFLLVALKYKISSIEKLIEYFYLFFCICYIFQYTIYPHSIFRLLDLTPAERRFRMVGQLILFLGYFYSLNKLLIFKSKKYLLNIFLGALVVLLLGFRTLLVALIVVSLVLIIRIIGFSVKKMCVVAVTVGVCAILLMQVGFVRNAVNNMMERNETANFKREDYIRILEFNYFTNEHFISAGEYFTGSGFPTVPSKYAKYMNSFREFTDSGDFKGSIAAWVDWGIIGLSWVGGVPLLIVLLAIIGRMIFMKAPPKYYYFSSLYLFLLLVSFTTVEFYRYGAFAFHAICLYSMEIIHRKYKYD